MNARQVWQAQAIDAPRVSLAYVRHVASDFDRRRRQRAALGYVLMLGAGAFNAVIAWQFLQTKPLAVAAAACLVLFVPYFIFRLHRHVVAESSPGDAGVLDTLRYQRRQLERQRDWRRGSWRWMLPGLLPFYGFSLSSLYFENDPVPWKLVGFMVLVLIASFGLSILEGERKARQSQREIDALDSLASDL
jgi:hypothetical protein